MALPARVTLIKAFSYRDAEEEWSNTYGLGGAAFADYAAMLACAATLANYERNVYAATSRVVRAIIYQPGAIISTRTIQFLAEVGSEPTGLLSPSGSFVKWAGDQAGWIRGKIGTSTKGKPVYVRKYFHDGFSLLGDSDETMSDWRGAAMTFAGQLQSGTAGSGRPWVGPDGETVTLLDRSKYVTTRTLKRRGRRPTPSP
jgi:hypothetical protein